MIRLLLALAEAAAGSTGPPVALPDRPIDVRAAVRDLGCPRRAAGEIVVCGRAAASPYRYRNPDLYAADGDLLKDGVALPGGARLKPGPFTNARGTQAVGITLGWPF